MKITVAVLALIWVLTMTAQASVTFTPPGSSTPMVGNTFTMTPSSDAKKMGSTAKVQVGMTKDQKTWYVDAAVMRGHKNGLYALWLANKTPRMLGAPKKADANGSIKLSYMGPTNPLTFKSIDVYYLPTANAAPGKGAVLAFSLETSKMMPKGGR